MRQAVERIRASRIRLDGPSWGSFGSFDLMEPGRTCGCERLGERLPEATANIYLLLICLFMEELTRKM